MRFTIPLLLTLSFIAGCAKEPMPSSKPDSETSTPQKETVEQDQTTDEVETSVKDNVPSRGEEIAATLLNDEIDEQERRDLFPEYPQYAAEIVTAMTAGYPFDEEEEYRRIPWIWRVSINATKTLNQEEIQELLEVSLPAEFVTTVHD